MPSVKGSIKVIIERASDGTYSAYSENMPGVYGMGDTPQEAKEEAVKGFNLYIKLNNRKQLAKDYRSGELQLVFKFDTVSLLNYYQKIFTKSALEHLTGINQKQLQHYSSGLKKPRPEQRKKIETALHTLGNELISVEL